MENAVSGVRSVELEICGLQSAAAFFSRVWNLEQSARAMERSIFAEQGDITTFLRCISHTDRQRYDASCSMPPIACRWMHFTIGLHRALSSAAGLRSLIGLEGDTGSILSTSKAVDLQLSATCKITLMRLMLRIDRTKSHTLI